MLSLLQRIILKLAGQEVPERINIGVFGLPEAGATTLIKQLHTLYGSDRTTEKLKQQRNYIFQLIFENFKHVVERVKPTETVPGGTSFRRYEVCIGERDWRNGGPIPLCIFKMIKEVSNDDAYQAGLSEVAEQLDARVRSLFEMWNENERERILSYDYAPTINECIHYIVDDNAVFNLDECRFKRKLPVKWFGDRKVQMEFEFVFINRKDNTTFHDFVYDNSSKKTMKSILIVVPVNQSENDFEFHSLPQLSDIAEHREDLRIDVILDEGDQYTVEQRNVIIQGLNTFVEPEMHIKNHHYLMVNLHAAEIAFFEAYLLDLTSNRKS